MADRVWAKKAFELWRVQQDQDGSLQKIRHYSPEYVLQRFSSGRSRSTSVYESRPWQSGRDEDLLLTVFDLEGKKFEEIPWRDAFGTADIYAKIIENFSKEAYARDGKTYKVFDTLLSVDDQIFRGLADPIWQIYQEDQNSGSNAINLSRYTVNSLRKFLFLANSVQNKDDIQHLVLNDDRMADAKKKRKAFMNEKRLGHERELWLNNAEQMILHHHYDVANQLDISELDREDYRANARERFIVFWKPAEKGDEFVLTDNSFGCFEGGKLGVDAKLVINMEASTQARHLYTKDYMWHQLYVISPTLVIALCHGSLADKELTNQHRTRYGLGPSVLEKLPHNYPKNYYKDMTRDECRFLGNGWVLPPGFANGFSARLYDGKSAESEGVEKEFLCFPIQALDSSQVAKVNAVLLQNRSTPSPLESICIRPSAEQCLLRTLATFEKIDWQKASTVPQRKGFMTLKKELKSRNTYRRDTETTNSATSFSSAQSRSSASGAPGSPEENPFDRRSDPPSSPRADRVRPVRPHLGSRNGTSDPRPDPMVSSEPNLGSKEQNQPRRPIYRDHRRTIAPEQSASLQEHARSSRPASFHEGFPVMNADLPLPSAEQSRSRGSSYYRDQKRNAGLAQPATSAEQSRSRGSSFYRVEVPPTSSHPPTPLEQSWHTVSSASGYPDGHIPTNTIRPEPSQSRQRPRKAPPHRETKETASPAQADIVNERPRSVPSTSYLDKNGVVIGEVPIKKSDQSPKRPSIHREKHTIISAEHAEIKQERSRTRRLSTIRDKHPTIITEQSESSPELPQRSTKRDKNTEIITEQPPSPGESRRRRTSTYRDGRKTIIKEQPQTAQKQSRPRRLSTHHDIPNKIVTEQAEATSEPLKSIKRTTSVDQPVKSIPTQNGTSKEPPRSRRLSASHEKHAKVFTDDSEMIPAAPARVRHRRQSTYRESRRPTAVVDNEDDSDDEPVIVNPAGLPLMDDVLSPTSDDQQSRSSRIARAAEYVETQQAFQPLPIPPADEADGFGVAGSGTITQSMPHAESRQAATTTTASTTNSLASPERRERRYHKKPAPLEIVQPSPPFSSSVIVEVGKGEDDVWEWEDEGYAEGHHDGLPAIDENRSPTWPQRKQTVRFEKTSPKTLRHGVPRKVSITDIKGVRFNRRR